MSDKKQPIQPLALDEHGVLRFKENALVNYILDNGGIDMNDLACQNFPQEDKEQFAQLIGYSLSGFGDLSYVSDDTYETADNMYRLGQDEKDARILHLEKTLSEVRKHARGLATEVFRICSEDLKE